VLNIPCITVAPELIELAVSQFDAMIGFSLLQDEEHSHSLPTKRISKFPRVLIPSERGVRSQCEN
jgi:hypothetical protein